MKIELTPHGRYLLSIGKLKPHSYRFFDDNVVYDSSACENGGTSEEQNMTHIRITEQTPLLKLNPNISGVETNFNKFTSDSVAIKDMRDPINDDQLTTNSEAIGTCAYDSKNSTAIALDIFGQNLVESSILNYYSSSSGRAQIPQIPINMFASASVFKDIDSEIFDSELFTSYSDGSGYALNYVDPIIRLREFNGFDEKDNFSITAYKVETGTMVGSWVYTRLKMESEIKKIVEGMLVVTDEASILDEDFGEEGDSLTETLDSDSDFLSFYIDLTMDRMIPDEEICKRVQDYEIENIFLDDEIICPDPEFSDNYDIYGTFVDDSDLEDCD